MPERVDIPSSRYERIFLITGMVSAASLLAATVVIDFRSQYIAAWLALMVILSPFSCFALRSRTIADESGLSVRDDMQTRHLKWSQIYILLRGDEIPQINHTTRSLRHVDELERYMAALQEWIR